MTEENNVEQFLGIVSQYTKDLSFECINPMSKLQGSATEQPQIDVQLKVLVERLENPENNPNLFEVSLLVNINAKLDKPMFILDLKYVGEFAVQGFPQDLMNPILYIECPRLIFPFVRSIIASTVGEGGFPPLYLSPVNFAELYQNQNQEHTLQ